MERLIPVLGLCVMVSIAWSLSSDRRRFPVRVVVGGLLMQFLLAVLVLRSEIGQSIFQSIGNLFTNLLDCVDKGAGFVFGEGGVSTPDGYKDPVTPAYKVHFVAFKVLPTIIFFSSLMSVLYYVGAMQKLVGAISFVMQKTLGTSGAETLSAAGNIFVGQTEAPLLVRPYINTMTRSELMAVMVGGFATIAGGVMAAYVGLGISPVHLLTASLMSAPAALVIAKIMQPEVERPLTLGKVEITPPMEATNVIDAAARGASDGMTLALNVAAMLIAFLGLIYMLDASLEAITQWITLKTTGTTYRLNFTQMMGWISRPFAWLMGIETRDLPIAGEILGKRIVTNEFIAYLDLSAKPQSANGAPALSERTKTILTYALCGFANVGSIGIQIGGLGPLAPDRRADLVRLGVRAMIGGLLACYMTACLASILIP
ncbi:MAG: NupC/NupG family nucleoside CNT transporter [Planctomycetota bacterium]|nr:MAG: NupC/NupG family nucleoside CNT transporter [Planctomycetota bacterium]